MKSKNSYHIFAMITIIFWSLAYVLTRLSLQYFSSYSLGVLRYLAASGALAVFVFTAKVKPPQKKDLPLFLLSGAVGFFLYIILFNKGQETVMASTASVVIATVPVMTSLLARFLYQEKLLAYQWIAILIEFAGVILLTSFRGGMAFDMGLVWLVLAAIALSIYNLLQRKLTARYTAVQTASYSIFLGTLMLSVFLPGAVSEARQAPVIMILYLLLLGIFSSAVAYVSWAQAFAQAKKTSQVSNYMFLTPFLTGLLGFLLAGEVPDRATVYGGAVILLGVFLFNFGGKILNISPPAASPHPAADSDTPRRSSR